MDKQQKDKNEKNTDFNIVELEEDGKKGIIRIDGTQLKAINGYKIKRDADTVELMITISTSVKNFKTKANP